MPYKKEPVRQAMCPVKRRTTLIFPRTSAIRPPSFTSFNSTTSITHVSGPQGGAPHEGHATCSGTCAPLVYVHTLWACCARRELFFFEKDVVHVVGTPPSPRSSKGFLNIHQLCLENSMVRPGWGATSNSGRELTRGCYALKQKYRLPCPPPPLLQYAIFLAPTYVPQSDQCDEAAISSIYVGVRSPPRPLYLAP